MTGFGDWLERNGVGVIATLAIIDLVTLVITVVIALNQHASLNKANEAIADAQARGCLNSGSLIRTDQRQIDGYNRQLTQTTEETFRTYFPLLDPAQLHQIVAQQRAQLLGGRQQARAEIKVLSRGCSVAELNASQ